MKLSEAFPRRM